MSDGKPFLRPAGLLWGRDAEEAIAGGDAGRLAGQRIGFTRIELSLRHESLVSRSWYSYRDLSASSDNDIAERLELIGRDRPNLPGTEPGEPAIMGIVNVTPDSFSDGGQAFETDVAIAQGLELAAAGAAILDVGGESTRPGSDPVALDEEISRVMPVIEALASQGLAVSVDTRKAKVMTAAVDAGAAIINDVSALTFDSQSVAMAKRLDVPVILMHAQGDPKTMQQNPTYDDVALDVFDVLEGWIDACVAAGMAREHLAVDPGIGFGKIFRHNLELLQRASLFHGLGVPLVYGASRKGFIGALTGETTAGLRLGGSVGAALAAFQQGVQIGRVHDVKATVEALKVWRSAVDPDVAAV